MCLGYTPDGIVLVSGYYVTCCLDLLFSKWSRTDLYVDASLLITRTDGALMCSTVRGQRCRARRQVSSIVDTGCKLIAMPGP